MTAKGETVLQLDERHVREGDTCVAHQEAILAELPRGGHASPTFETGKALLETLQKPLVLEQHDLARERARASS